MNSAPIGSTVRFFGEPPQPDLADVHLEVDLLLLGATFVCSSLFLISSVRDCFTQSQVLLKLVECYLRSSTAAARQDARRSRSSASR
jgi:hypothetical protein